MKSISTIKAKINRLNVKTDNTNFFKDLDEIKQGIILKNVHSKNNDDLIYGYYKTEDYWWFITKSSLIISENNSINKYNFNEIKNLNLNEIFGEKNNKNECKSIEIFLQDGIELNLKVEENTWHAVTNILKFLYS